MSRIDITKARVYVCTDYKCSQENYEGKWLYLIHYKSIEEFTKVCKEVHADEHNPRFLYFDYEDLPYVYISQYWIESGIFEFLRLLVEQDALLHPAISVWINYRKPDLAESDLDGILETFKIHFEGPFQDRLKYAVYYAREHLNISPEHDPDFNFNSLANFLFKEDFVILEGYVFKKSSS